LKWLPKAKETPKTACVNRVVLLGAIGKYGVEVRYVNSGTACTSFMLVVTEQGQDGKDHPTLIPCEV
jgi:hypothetical protein